MSLCLSLSVEVQGVCGFTCEDLDSMFRELKGLGLVVKQLSNELREVVSKEACSRPALFRPSLSSSFSSDPLPLWSCGTFVTDFG